MLLKQFGNFLKIKKNTGLANVSSNIFMVQQMEKQVLLKILTLENVCAQTDAESQLVEFKNLLDAEQGKPEEFRAEKKEMQFIKKYPNF